MKNKIKVLEKYMKNLDNRLFIEYFEDTQEISLKYEENGGIWWLTTYYLENNNFGISPKGLAPDSYDKLVEYCDDFRKICKKLFHGENEMEILENIEVTNLDELQKLLSDSKRLVCKLQSKIDKINEWQPEIKEKENKIDILNDYMKKINCHFFVEREKNTINLNYNVENEDFWYIGSYNLDDNNFIIYEGINGLKEYNMIMYHYKDFVDKVKELYGGEE